MSGCSQTTISQSFIIPIKAQHFSGGWDEDSLHHECRVPDYLTWPYPIHHTALRKLHHLRDQTFHSFTLLYTDLTLSRAYTVGYKADPSTSCDWFMSQIQVYENSAVISSDLVMVSEIYSNIAVSKATVLTGSSASPTEINQQTSSHTGCKQADSWARSSILELVIWMISLIYIICWLYSSFIELVFMVHGSWNGKTLQWHSWHFVQGDLFLSSLHVRCHFIIWSLTKPLQLFRISDLWSNLLYQSQNGANNAWLHR